MADQDTKMADGSAEQSNNPVFNAEYLNAFLLPEQAGRKLGSGRGESRRAKEDLSTKASTVRGRKRTERLKDTNPLKWLKERIANNDRAAVSKAQKNLRKTKGFEECAGDEEKEAALLAQVKTKKMQERYGQQISWPALQEKLQNPDLMVPLLEQLGIHKIPERPHAMAEILTEIYQQYIPNDTSEIEAINADDAQDTTALKQEDAEEDNSDNLMDWLQGSDDDDEDETQDVDAEGDQAAEEEDVRIIQNLFEAAGIPADAEVLTEEEVEKLKAQFIEEHRSMAEKKFINEAGWRIYRAHKLCILDDFYMKRQWMESMKIDMVLKVSAVHAKFPVLANENMYGFTQWDVFVLCQHNEIEWEDLPWEQSSGSSAEDTITELCVGGSLMRFLTDEDKGAIEMLIALELLYEEGADDMWSIVKCPDRFWKNELDGEISFNEYLQRHVAWPVAEGGELAGYEKAYDALHQAEPADFWWQHMVNEEDPHAFWWQTGDNEELEDEGEDDTLLEDQANDDD